jgi:ABC-2 type transport system permease protein
VLYAVLLPAPVTDPHRRGRGALLSGDDIDGGRSQAQGLLAFWTTAATALPTAAVLTAGAVLHLPALGWAALPVGAATGAGTGWLLGAAAHRHLHRAGPELLALLRHGPTAAPTTTGARPDAARLPARLSVPVGVMMTFAVLATFPQGLVPLILAVSGVDHRVRAWFLARYLPVPAQLPVALAFLAAGLATGTAAVLLVRRHRRRASPDQ